MAPSPPIPLAGYKYFQQLDSLLAPLRPAGTPRDKAGNRQLFFDQYCADDPQHPNPYCADASNITPLPQGCTHSIVATVICCN